jgi:hypothetical protein
VPADEGALGIDLLDAAGERAARYPSYDPAGQAE